MAVLAYRTAIHVAHKKDSKHFVSTNVVDIKQYSLFNACCLHPSAHSDYYHIVRDGHTAAQTLCSDGHLNVQQGTRGC